MRRLLALCLLAVPWFAAGEPAPAKPETPHPDWKVTDFPGKGEVTFEPGVIRLAQGDDLTGVNWTGKLFKLNYEITLDAMRVDGDDFFCGLTFPYKDNACSLIVGGWGGGLVGISCFDYQDAYNNETARFRKFENNRWYSIRVRVLDDKIQAWIDGEQVVDAAVNGRKVDVRTEVEKSKPLGVATWRTTGAFKNFEITELPPAP